MIDGDFIEFGWPDEHLRVKWLATGDFVMTVTDGDTNNRAVYLLSPREASTLRAFLQVQGERAVA